MTMPVITPSTILRKSLDVRHRQIGDEAVVVRQSAGEVLVVNDVGGAVLDLLDQAPTVRALLDRLAGQYDVEPSILEQDVLVYLQELLEAGVIEAQSG